VLFVLSILAMVSGVHAMDPTDDPCGATKGPVYALPACAIIPSDYLQDRSLLTSISQGQAVSAQPGQTLTFDVTYQIWQGQNPSEIDQLMFIPSWTPSWPPPAGYYFGIYNDVPPSAPSVSGSASFSLTAPSKPGTYYLWFVQDANYGYDQAAGDFQNTLPLPPAHLEIDVSEFSPCPQYVLFISVTTNKPVYNVGDTIVVNWDTSQFIQGATATLSLSGPSGTYTFNLDSATLMGSSYTVGQAEQRDVGSWTATLSGSNNIGACAIPFRGSTTFQVGGGTYQVNLYSSLEGSSNDLGATVVFDGVFHITPDSVSVTLNTWHTIAVLPYTVPYVFVNWELGGPSQITDHKAHTGQVYIDHPGYIKAWYTVVNPKQASLTSTVILNPITLSGGTSGYVTYTLSETNGVGVTINSAQWQFIYPDQSKGPSGSDIADFRVPLSGQTSWDRWPLLPQEVVQYAAANQWTYVTLRYIFIGIDDNGNTTTTVCDLVINLSSS